MLATELLQPFFSVKDLQKGMKRTSQQRIAFYTVWIVTQLKIDFEGKGINVLPLENHARKTLIFNACSIPIS